MRGVLAVLGSFRPSPSGQDLPDVLEGAWHLGGEAGGVLSWLPARCGWTEAGLLRQGPPLLSGNFRFGNHTLPLSLQAEDWSWLPVCQALGASLPSQESLNPTHALCKQSPYDW